jgi:hypothetical protein
MAQVVEGVDSGEAVDSPQVKVERTYWTYQARRCDSRFSCASARTMSILDDGRGDM